MFGTFGPQVIPGHHAAGVYTVVKVDGGCHSQKVGEV